MLPSIVLPCITWKCLVIADVSSVINVNWIKKTLRKVAMLLFSFGYTNGVILKLHISKGTYFPDGARVACNSKPQQSPSIMKVWIRSDLKRTRLYCRVPCTLTEVTGEEERGTRICSSITNVFSQQYRTFCP
jgi:hypothetical protein